MYDGKDDDNLLKCTKVIAEARVNEKQIIFILSCMKNDKWFNEYIQLIAKPKQYNPPALCT